MGLLWNVILVGIVTVHMVYGRSTAAPAKPPSKCPALVETLPDHFCMVQTSQSDGFPCQQDGDCSIMGQVCCPHYCNTKVCKSPIANEPVKTETTTTSAKGKPVPPAVPSYVKDPQNVPTRDELANVNSQPKATEPNSTVPSSCPALLEVLPDFCMLQTKQDGISYQQDGDCFITGQVCCPHYCDAKVCKDKKQSKSNSDKTETTTTSVKSKPDPSTVPPYVKHPQNVPTRDELAKSYVKTQPKASEPSSTETNSDKTSIISEPSVNKASTKPKDIQNVPVLKIDVDNGVVIGSNTSKNIVKTPDVQTSSTSAASTTSAVVTISALKASSQTSDTTTASTMESIVTTSKSVTATSSANASTSSSNSLTSEETSNSTSAAAASTTSTAKSMADVTSPPEKANAATATQNEATTTTTVTKANCPSLNCGNTCVYERKVDTLGCKTCDCLYKDQCPTVVPIRNRMLCALAMSLNTCDDDTTCRQGSICCLDACGNKVCTRVTSRSFRTLSMSISG